VWDFRVVFYFTLQLGWKHLCSDKNSVALKSLDTWCWKTKTTLSVSFAIHHLDVLRDARRSVHYCPISTKFGVFV
jgi:hypothetical protein